MTAPEAESALGPRALCIGPQSPPVTGQAVVHERMIKLIARQGFIVTSINTAPYSLRGSRSKRIVRLLSALFQQIRLTTTRPYSFLYITMDAGPGMYFQCLIALLARLTRNQIIAHHHSYYYINQKANNFRLFCLFVSPTVVHVVNSETMARDMRSTYPKIGKIFAIRNISFAPEPTKNRHGRERPDKLVLGHLSNLCEPKGIRLVAEVIEACHEARLPVALKLGGPAIDDVAEAAIERLRQAGVDFAHLGAVAADGKGEFYRSIDLFLFPTLYKVEATPLVLHEAQAFGVPILALRRGSIDHETFGPAAYIVDRPEDFVERAVTLIRAYLSDPDRYCRDVTQTAEFYTARRGAASGDLRRLLETLRINKRAGT